MSMSGKRVALFVVALMLLTTALTPLLPNKNVSAAQITVRSLTLESGTTDGGSKPGGTVNHFFQFSVPPPANSVGSIKFEYCTLAAGTCTLPGDAGNGNLVNTTGATLLNETGATGFTMVNTTNGAPYLTRTAAAIGNGTDPTALTYRLGNIVNPSDLANPNLTFFVRISTYSGTNGSTGLIDSGTVAASTATQIILQGIMPESLIFCTGATIDVSATDLPQCNTATSGAINFNQLFSPQGTTWATSQMAASTNATTGYAITVTGPTMSSGVSNEIAAIGGTATASNPGSGQFGLNLVDDSTDTTIGTTSPNPITYYTDPDSHGGGDVYPAANGTNFKGQPKANFDTAATYAFTANTANLVAASDNSGAGPTDGQRFTTTYIVNVPGSQAAGTYTSTLTYICTPTF
jgi:hypothetical protein